MRDIRRPTRKSPVVGRFTGTYTIDSRDPVNFDLRNVLYQRFETPILLFMEAGNRQAKVWLIFSGGVSIEQPGYYPFTGQIGGFSAQAYINNEEFSAFEDPTGGLTVRFVEPDGDYKRLEGDGTIQMKAYDRKKNPHDVVLTITRFDVRTKPI